MKKPWLAGLLNVLIPGLGMAYLRKWESAVAYFLWTILFLLLAPLTLLLLVYNLHPTAQTLIWVICTPAALLYVLWDLVSTPYLLAKGKEPERKPFWAAILCVFSPSLGFLYLKRWDYAFTFLFWALFVTFMALFVGSITIGGFKIPEQWQWAANLYGGLFKDILPLGIKAYVIVDAARLAFQLAKEKKATS